MFWTSFKKVIKQIFKPIFEQVFKQFFKQDFKQTFKLLFKQVFKQVFEQVFKQALKKLWLTYRTIWSDLTTFISICENWLKLISPHGIYILCCCSHLIGSRVSAPQLTYGTNEQNVLAVWSIFRSILIF